MTEQPVLGVHCSHPQPEEGARKCAPRFPGQNPHLVGTYYCGRNNTKRKKKLRIIPLLDRDGDDRPQMRTALIVREITRYNIDVAALNETRLAGEGQLFEKKELVTLSFGVEEVAKSGVRQVSALQ